MFSAIGASGRFLPFAVERPSVTPLLPPRALVKVSALALLFLASGCAAGAQLSPSSVVTETETKLALRELVDTFSILADQKEARAQTELFTEDATVTTYSGGESVSELRGREQIGDAFERFLSGFETVYHMNGQHVVELDGGTATGTLYCLVYLFDAAGGQRTIGVRYRDEYVFVGGRWLIASRTSYFDWQTVEEAGS